MRPLTIRLPTAREFRFAKALAYLGRSTEEALYRVNAGTVRRWVELGGERIFLEVSQAEPGWLDLMVMSRDAPQLGDLAVRYVREWFDLDRDLTPFYALAASDPLLGPLVQEHDGLRLVGVPDLFEALAWAVIGQQIHLGLAYTLKRRFVETFGMKVRWGDGWYWLFPIPDRIAALDVADLQALKMTRRKSEYLIGIAQAIVSGQLSKQELLQLEPAAARERLTEIRGVGEWTASYVAMRCLLDVTAFPTGDVGLQNAVKQRLALATKPTPDQLRDLGQRWSGWEAYATFYLWRSLQGYSA